MGGRGVCLQVLAGANPSPYILPILKLHKIFLIYPHTHLFFNSKESIFKASQPSFIIDMVKETKPEDHYYKRYFVLKHLSSDIDDDIKNLYEEYYDHVSGYIERQFGNHTPLMHQPHKPYYVTWRYEDDNIEYNKFSSKREIMEDSKFFKKNEDGSYRIMNSSLALERDIALELAGFLPMMYEQGQSDSVVCKNLNLSPSRFKRWVNEFEELREAYEIGTNAAKAWWEELGREGASCDRKIQPAVWSMNMKNRHGYADKLDTRHTDKDGNDLANLPEAEITKKLEDRLKQLSADEYPTSQTSSPEPIDVVPDE